MIKLTSIYLCAVYVFLIYLFLIFFLNRRLPVHMWGCLQLLQIFNKECPLRGVKLIFTGGHVSLVVAFKGLSIILGLYTFNYSLTRGKELAQCCCSGNKVPCQVKQGGGPDSASGPWVCHLCPT